MSKRRLRYKKPVICDYCGRGFKWKAILIKHILMHTNQQAMPRVEGLTCDQCNMVFKNKGLLVCHNRKIHQKKESVPIIENKYRHICQACQINFFHLKDLKHHIREFHFNLLAQIPYCHYKKVNQVWFEKVMNSKYIVEIKKVAQNTLLLRKLDENTAMKVSDHITEVIDLHDLYPTHNKNNVQCTYCLKSYDKVYINKHINDVHLKYNDTEIANHS